MTDPLSFPAIFGEQVLGLSLYDWQVDTVAPLRLATGPKARRISVALAAPNGSGKDERVIPVISFWTLAAHKRGKVVITTKSQTQLEGQTIPQLERHIKKFQGYTSVRSPRYEITTPTGGKLTAFVSREGERVEGWHKEDDIDGPLVWIVNEAKTVADEIFAGIDRCTSNAVFYISSTGEMRGRFFKCFTELKSQWTTVKASLKDCPHIPKEHVASLIATHGEDHPIVRSALYGEFMSQEEVEKYIVNHLALEFLLQNPPKHMPGMKVAFCDFADGGAENVIAYRDGNKIEVVAAWRESNKFASVTRFISEFRKLGLTASQVWGDAADKEMCDLLEEAGWKIHRQNFGSPANNSDIYLSWGAEAWRELGIGIEKREWILPRDDKLIEQLTSRYRSFGRAGKLGAEEKHSMKKRNLPSPDRGDAVAGAASVRDYAQVIAPFTQRYKGDYPDYSHTQGQRTDGDAGLLADIGASAGL